MSFRSIILRQEEWPWSWPLRLGGTLSVQRIRCMIIATDDQGRHHQAELAPCPGVHTESLSEALQQWDHEIQDLLKKPWLPEQWNWTRPAFGLLDLPSHTSRSVLTAVEQLLLSWAQHENPGEVSLPAPMRIEGSALLTLQDRADDSWREFLQLWDQGFRVFKCKVGRLSPMHEYDLLEKMTAHGSGALSLRLDANRGMSAEAVTFWKTRHHSLPIAYWEEAAGMEPLALDESLWEDSDIPQAAAWILKPSRLGLSRTVELLTKASQYKIPCVLSNAFDSGLSLRSSAWIYAAFCSDPQPLGYGTTRFLPPDNWQSESWGQPFVTIPCHPFAQEDEA